MKQIFELRETNRGVHEKYRLNLNIPNYNQVTFGKMNLRIFGPNIWNNLTYHSINCKCVICKELKTIFLFVSPL